MSTKINLLTKEKKKPYVISIKNKFSSGLLIFFLLLSLAGSGVYIYWLSLVGENESLDRTIARYKQDIDRYKDVEEEKSSITIKVKELQKLASGRFDYLQAIDDAQRLFGYSLVINSLNVESDGSVSISADKQNELQISEELALNTNIAVIELSLRVDSSEELQEAIDSLRVFHGIGLKGATVANTTRLEDGGYEVDFVLNLNPSV